MKCRKCGHEIPARLLKQDAFKCPSCGNQYKKKQPSVNSNQQMRLRGKKQRAKSLLRKKLWKLPVWGWLVILLLGLIGMGMNSEEQAVQEKNPYIESDPAISVQSHLYDNAEIRDVLNGYGTEKIGEYSIVRVDSSEITVETLSDWYFNYVEKNDFNWCMILYTDKDDNSGVYAISSMVEENVIFEQDGYGDYSVGSNDYSTIYYPSDNGILVDMASDPEEKEWEAKFQATEKDVEAYILTALSSYNPQYLSLDYWVSEPDIYAATFEVVIGEQSIAAVKKAIQEIESLTADYRLDYSVIFTDEKRSPIATVVWGAAHNGIGVIANGKVYDYQSLDEFPTK